MFITQGTVFSQIFWFLVCFMIIMTCVKLIFMKKIGNIIESRHKKLAAFKADIKELREKTQILNQKSISEELEIHEKLRLENAKIANEFKENIDNQMKTIKDSFISDQLKLQQDMKKIKNDLIKDIDKILPELAKKAMKKIH